VYELGAGDRVRDAVRRAGGPGRRADLGALNLAAQLQDGQQVVVPAKGAAGSDARTAGPLSLSSATADDLEELDGIGPALAARIVDHRDALGGFASVDQLDEVPGIGPARLEALRDEVVP
jgi:competence protein ComEA